MSRFSATWTDELPKPPADKAFDGSTYSPQRDYARLEGQLGRVFNLMKDGQRRTIPQIASQVDGSEAAVSARLRDLRKDRYGSHTVQRKHIGSGLYEYWVIVNG